MQHAKERAYLKGRSGDEQAVAGIKEADDLGQNGVDILDAVGFVNDNILPGNLLEAVFFALADLVRSDDDIKVLGENARVDGASSLLFGTAKVDDVEAGHPSSDLSNPVVLGGLGHNDQVGAVNAADEFEVSEERYSLERLA